MIIDQKYLLFLLKLPFAKDYILEISQQSTLNMPKLPYAEIVEISVCTLQQQQKCINSLIDWLALHLKVGSEID